MDLSELGRFYDRHPGRKALLQKLGEMSCGHVFLKGLCASSSPLLFSTLLSGDSGRSMLFVLDDREEAAYFYNDLVQTIGEEQVLFFPSAYRRSAKYGQKDDASAILRTEVLGRLRSGGRLFVVTSADALAEKVVSGEQIDNSSITVSVGDTIDRDKLQDRLSDLGFELVDYVYDPGQYALRGSIVDIFSFSSEFPYRIDFFGDDVDSIRQFEVESQLSKNQKESVTIVPEMKPDAATSVSFFDFMPKDMVIAVHNLGLSQDLVKAIYTEVNDASAFSSKIREADALRNKSRKGFEEVETGTDTLPEMLDGEQFTERMHRFLRVEFGTVCSENPDCTINFSVSPQALFHKNFDLLSETLADYLGKGYKLYLLTDNLKQADRLRQIFEDRGDKISFTPVLHTLHEGFADNTLHACFFTDHQIFDRFHKYSLRSERARSGKVALTLKELSEFEIGDYVVHIDHGIGRFGGLVKMPVGGTMQEVIKLIYKNEDAVFVSIHALHKISKYKGREGEPPRVNTLGTGAWENMKERTKGKIKDIARDLIKLYAKRLDEEGYAYSPDSYLQNELEAGFMYEDTPDQAKATLAVKTDMESKRPMDRLVCGDVGFGKTEVAIRAAFKAVCDSKQVAVLVPTTILAFQHYQTFSERLKDFPCRIEYLSRAKSAKQVTQILEDLANGRIDILIGTHKLIGKGVKFKDLGLLIIDEEQKFGVAVKEKLKALKVNVDTLTLTATPIPRTLQFSLMGARDLSIIQTPPPNRYPIQTELHVFGADIIREAVNFEMSRNGQLFLISNRISSLQELADLVHREVPDARVCIGHGQMDPDELEKTLMGFINYDYDVLVATSIVENGIDIPNVNTIIVNNAHNFGLSDLHQMRGRVGRGNRKAFCYLLAPPLSVLPADTRRRLQAIENFSELGSGIQLALQDLDIRGAGNLLGAEQSGFIADLGYETYQKILKEAVRELKTDEFADLFARQVKEGQGNVAFVDECQVECDLEVLFPAWYVPNGSERIMLYRELDGLERDEDIEAYRKRLEDRFGKIPAQAEELIQLVRLRQKGKTFGIERIFLKGGNMSLFFVSDAGSVYYDSDEFGRVISYALSHPADCRMRDQDGKRSILIKSIDSVAAALEILERF